MKKCIFFLLLSLSQFARSDIITTSVIAIDWGDRPQDSVMVMLSSGHVLWYSQDEKDHLKAISDIYRKNFEAQINLKTKKIFSTAPKLNFQSASQNKAYLQPLPYSPTVVNSDESLKDLFTSARRTVRTETQCFNRAHIWSYEWRINQNIYSSKAWLFFTRKYIRKYQFDWWFHVAPILILKENDKLSERILDIKYAKTPLKLKQWTDIFIRDNADCPIISRYSDYADYPESGSCFVMKSSMYYYQPVDLEDLEITGNQKIKWIRNEVQEAYREAFDHTL